MSEDGRKIIESMRDTACFVRAINKAIEAWEWKNVTAQARTGFNPGGTVVGIIHGVNRSALGSPHHRAHREEEKVIIDPEEAWFW
jgi:hypothetical protein